MCRRRAGATAARRAATISANGVLPLTRLLRGSVHVRHHILGGLVAAVDSLPALVHRLLDGRREQDTRRTGRLELEELRIERVLQSANLERQGLGSDRT